MEYIGCIRSSYKHTRAAYQQQAGVGEQLRLQQAVNQCGRHAIPQDDCPYHYRACLGSRKNNASTKNTKWTLLDTIYY